LRSLQRIHDIALINKSFFDSDTKKLSRLRIEGYDISNLGSRGKVGSMVVFEQGEPAKNEYRKFKIKTIVGQSDVDCLQEVLERRLKHAEWTYPAVFLIDGGKPQVHRAVRVVKSFGLSIPVVGIAKGPERKRNDFILGSNKKEFIRFVHEQQELLIRVRDEAHRFAITYQRQTRKL
jgi:excinuclease ABC subunit C